MYFSYTWDDIKNSPSIQDKLYNNWQLELDFRGKLCMFISEVGKKLQVPQLVISVGCVYFHLFYTKHSFSDYDGYHVAAACLFLACKVEESRRKIFILLQQWKAVKDNKNDVLLQDSEYLTLRDKIFELERVLLDTIEYRLQIDLPYAALTEICRSGKGAVFIDRSPEERESIGQAAWYFVNDACFTVLPLIYPSTTIAIVCLGLSVEFMEIEGKKSNLAQNNTDWLEYFKVTKADYESARAILLEFLTRSSSKRNPKIEETKIVDNMQIDPPSRSTSDPMEKIPIKRQSSSEKTPLSRVNSLERNDDDRSPLNNECDDSFRSLTDAQSTRCDSVNSNFQERTPRPPSISFPTPNAGNIE